MLLVFGVAFEIPLFVVLLNLAGVVSGKALGRHRPWIILGTFVFAAVATPSTDPISMLFLAAPMTRAVPGLGDHRADSSTAAARARKRITDAYDDDEASDLDEPTPRTRLGSTDD